MFACLSAQGHKAAVHHCPKEAAGSTQAQIAATSEPHLAGKHPPPVQAWRPRPRLVSPAAATIPLPETSTLVASLSAGMIQPTVDTVPVEGWHINTVTPDVGTLQDSLNTHLAQQSALAPTTVSHSRRSGTASVDRARVRERPRAAAEICKQSQGLPAHGHGTEPIQSNARGWHRGERVAC